MITPVGNHRGSRSSLSTYKVSEYDELFTSLCTAQLLQAKAQCKDSARQEKIPTAGITGKAHGMVQLIYHELQRSPAPSLSIF